MPLFRSLYYKLQLLNRPPAKRIKTPNAPASLGGIDFGRGPLIDLYGPGTVFHRIKTREQAKKKARNVQNNFRGATVGFGLKLHTPTLGTTATNDLERNGPNSMPVSY